MKNLSRKMYLSAAASLAVAQVVYGEAVSVPAGNTTSLRNTTPGVTSSLPVISISGSTAMRNFTVSTGFTLLSPATGNSITLGDVGNEITYTFGSGMSSLQLANGNLNTNDVVTGASQTHSAVSVEWHEQGSVEGILEMADGQINNSIYANTVYDPNTGLGTFVNRNRWGGTSGGTNSGFSAPSNSTFNGFRVSQQATGNVQNGINGQNTVQMAISDVTATQGFSKGGTAAMASGSRIATYNTTGYGKGNPALLLDSGTNISGKGAASKRQSLVSEETLNYTSSITATSTAAVGNLESKTVAITATTFSANPGTGLTHLNRNDAQWLQANGRLSNGVNFNVASRDVNSGTRNVAALNTGLDPSFATGENDSGNGDLVDGGTSQVIIGSNLTFSNKTGGGAQLRPVVQRSRMAVGTLSLGDALSSAVTGSTTGLRVLDYRDDADDSDNNSNGGSFVNYADDGANGQVTKSGDPSAGFVRVSARSITNGSYAIWQQEQYVTVKNPDSQYATSNPNIKGDNSGHDVKDIRDNILGSVANFASRTSAASPGDALLDNSFVLPNTMMVQKAGDGNGAGIVSTRTLSGSEPAYRSDFVSNYGSKFDVSDPNDIRQGSSSSVYGAGIAGYTNPSNLATNYAPSAGNILITKRNYLFGDFNQSANGTSNDGSRKEVRDFRDLIAMQDAQSQLQNSGSGTDWNAGLSNSTTTGLSGMVAADRLAFQPTKGDLIVMGDFNSDGKFDGKDLNLFARGAAVADSGTNSSNYALSVTSTSRSGSGADEQFNNDFGDKIRASGILKKNAALEWLQTNATTQQKADASTDGGLAFEHRDVNRDGKVDFYDAAIVDGFNGKSVSNIDAQLSAVLATNTLAAGTTFVGVGNNTNPITEQTTGRKAISLVDVEQDDDGTIGSSDVASINTQMNGITNDVWTSGISQKVGPNTISFSRTGGTTTVPANASLRIAAGIVSAGGTRDPFSGGGNNLKIDNAGAFSITGGTKNVAAIVGNGNTSVAGSGSVLNADSITQNTISLTGGAVLTVRPNGTTTGISKFKFLSVTGNSKLNITNNSAIITGTSESDVRTMITSGFHGGDWLGTGITSSNAANDNDGVTAVGYANNNDLGASDYNGVPLGATDTIVKYTYYGDADLSGTVTLEDFTQFLVGYQQGGTPNWINGDFDYSGTVTLEDFSLFLAGYQGPNTPLTPSLALALSADAPHSAPLAESISIVPEPTSLGLLAVGAMGLLRRRRK